MKRFIAAVVVLALSACATVPNAAPSIQNACAVDTGLRPVVSALLATPGVAQPEDVAIVAAVRAIIDPICANPDGMAQSDAIAAVTNTTFQIIAVSAKLQQ